MSLVASGAHSDISSITFTYGTTPTVLNLGDATDADIDSTGTLISKGGGNAPGDTHVKTVNQKRAITIGGFDIAAFAAVPAGVEGVLTFILNDEKNGESTGALTVTLSHCQTPGNKVTAKYNEYATDTMTFTGRWTKDSGTGLYVDPLVITPVA